jgi:hypothetical protein|eukprot:4620192-Prymnesium_polylepis.2
MGRDGIIYLIRFGNGKGYVGQTVHSMNKRLTEHKKSGSGCKALSAAFAKYGHADATVSVIARCKESELNDMEKALIAKHGTMVPHGYNILPGGEAFRDANCQSVLREARIASKAFQAARREVQSRESTALARRTTAAAKRSVMEDESKEGKKRKLLAWRDAKRNALKAKDSLPEGSSRDPVKEVQDFFDDEAMEHRAKEMLEIKHTCIGKSKRAFARDARRKAVEGMTTVDAIKYMKQARCNALYVARKRQPAKQQEVKDLWDEEWREFEEWLRTQALRASLPNDNAHAGELDTSSGDGASSHGQIEVTHSRSRPSAVFPRSR